MAFLTNNLEEAVAVPASSNLYSGKPVCAGNFPAVRKLYNFLLCPKLIILFLLAFIPGCSKAPKKDIPISPAAAHQKFVQLCKDDYNLNIVTKAFEHSLWIYLPLDDSYLSIAASKDGPMKSSAPDEKLNIKFLDGAFTDSTFQIRYDIGLHKSYIDHKGIETRVSEEYSAKQRFLFEAITRAYADVEKLPDSDRHVEEVPGDVTYLDDRKSAAHKKLVQSDVETASVPDFFVMVIADIEKGIETKMYVYLQDLLRATHDQGFGEEYLKRLVVDQPIGHEVIIGDKTGSHLDAYDLTWPEFLTKQMLYRIQYKYQQSAFPPSEDTRSELLNIAADTVGAYGFTDFSSVELHDLSDGSTDVVGREELSAYSSEPSRGRLIHIRFQ